MFIEDDFENAMVTLLQEAMVEDNALYDVYLAPIRIVETISNSDLTPDTLSDYGGSVPMVILGFAPNHTATQTHGARGDAQTISYEFRVFLATDGYEHPTAAIDNARPILRALRNLFRGLRYTGTEGSNSGVARLLYQSQSLVSVQEGLALQLQTYEVNVFDRNSTERQL